MSGSDSGGGGGGGDGGGKKRWTAAELAAHKAEFGDEWRLPKRGDAAAAAGHGGGGDWGGAIDQLTERKYLPRKFKEEVPYREYIEYYRRNKRDTWTTPAVCPCACVRACACAIV
jgi:hypothetical protein